MNEYKITIETPLLPSGLKIEVEVPAGRLGEALSEIKEILPEGVEGCCENPSAEVIRYHEALHERLGKLPYDLVGLAHRKALDSYKKDTVVGWLSERTERLLDHRSVPMNSWISQLDAYSDYLQYVEDFGYRDSVTKRKFRLRLNEIGVPVGKSNGVRFALRLREG